MYEFLWGKEGGTDLLTLVSFDMVNQVSQVKTHSDELSIIGGK